MHSYLLKQRKQLFQEEGFSLMEVMVAILIVGILAAIAVPVYINAQN
jgi:type IV pilus assembly protein PilA